MRQWSQETLADLSGLSVRTVQRVERGEPSGLDTRRALARAFGLEDLDHFNKPHSIPALEEVKAQKEKFEKENLILDVQPVTSGRELVRLFEGAEMDVCTPAVELTDGPAYDFAALVDYLHDYRDCSDEYSETLKLEVFGEVQGYIAALDAARISLRFARRDTRLIAKDVPDSTSCPVTIIYLVAYRKGEEPKKFVVSRRVQL